MCTFCICLKHIFEAAALSDCVLRRRVQILLPILTHLLTYVLLMYEIVSVNMCVTTDRLHFLRRRQ